MPRLREEQVAAIVRAYKSGSLASSLATRFGVSERTIHYWLKIKKVATRAATTARVRADQIAKSVRAYKSGTSVAVLAARFGVSGHTVYGWLRTNGVVLTSATALAPRLREDQVAEIVRAYKSGVSTPLLAARFGVSTSAISRRLRTNEVITRTWVKPRLVPYDVLCTEYLSGLTAEQVGKKHGVGINTVCRALKLSGIAVRAPLRGSAHYAWKAQKRNYQGYIELSDGQLLHRVVAERLLGRPLKHWEASHHVDADRQNNTDENIVVMPEREHNRFHTFLRHRGLSVSRENLEKFCRQESPVYFRFTAVDHARWSGELPSIVRFGRLRKPPQKCRIKSCSTICKTIRGLCNKHYQRKRARERGYWISGGGRRHPFTGTRFIGTRKGVPRSG